MPYQVLSPNKLIFGPFVYTLSKDLNAINKAQVEMGFPLYGYSDHFRQEIVSHPDLEHDRECETIVHESLHVMWTNSLASMKDQEEEEMIVSALAPQVLDWIRDNPDLMLYIQENR